MLGANPVTVILLALRNGVFQLSKRLFALGVSELEPFEKVMVRTDVPAARATCGEINAATTRKIAKRITDTAGDCFAIRRFAMLSTV